VAKSAAERQKEFRERNKGKTRKLEVLLPSDEFTLLHDNAKQQGLTKAKYVVSLLHDNNGGNRADQGNNAIELIRENKMLAKDNAQLTIRANEEHLNRVGLEAKHEKQIKALNDLIYELNDKPLKARNDELEAELAAIKAQIKNHTHTTLEYTQLERENKKLVSQTAELERQSSTDQASISRLVNETINEKLADEITRLEETIRIGKRTIRRLISEKTDIKQPATTKKLSKSKSAKQKTIRADSK